MKYLLTIITTFLMCFTATSSAHARAMSCSYDYISHLTTYTIAEDRSSGDLSVSYVHSISPSGGEETYLFKDTEASALTGSENWHHVYGKLFQVEDFPSVLMVDFEQAKLIEVQLLERSMMNNTPVHYLHWDCRRVD